MSFTIYTNACTLLCEPILWKFPIMASNCALILAAGRGERLRPLTDTTPKPLLKVGTSRLIEFQINNLGNAGYTQVYINRAHLRECFDSMLDRQSFGTITITYLDEPDGALETAGAIVNAFRFIDCDRLLVVNGDIWCDYDFRALNGLPASGDNAHIVLTKNPAHHPAGDFCIDKGRVRACKNGEAAYTFTGIGMYRRGLFTEYGDGYQKLAPVLHSQIAQNRVSGSIHAGEWMDIGTPGRLELLRSRLRPASE